MIRGLGGAEEVHRVALAGALTLLATAAALGQEAPPAPGAPLWTDTARALSARVEIVRTEYGVPHVLARDLKAMGFGLSYAQSEDYGDRIAYALMARRGVIARYLGYDSIDGDFTAREMHATAAATLHRVSQDTRDFYAGFAEGLNHFMRLHPERFAAWMSPDFTAVDVHAREVQTWSRGDARAFLRALHESSDAEARAAREAFDLDGSNAWALHPSRTTSGHAILLRNPHLSWEAGYYEAHVRVPGVLDFYGDFRIGGAFGIVGGFNARLGWATTNNSPRYSQVYALERHPRLPDHAVLDGAPLPLTRREATVDYATADGGLAYETRVTRWSPYGPVIHETDERIFILKDPRDGEFRRAEQFLRMMQAGSLEEWLAVMHMRAHPSSNFTYADADGNIVHLYNARIPALPHEPTGDTAALARGAADMWHTLVPVDDLPLYVNPPGGYVQQANDPPDWSNLNVALGRDTIAPNLPAPRLRLRSQLSLALIHSGARLSLEDVVRLKHSPRMLLAERVVDDLLAAVRQAGRAELDEAANILDAWDRTAAAESRGGVLFDVWWDAYREIADTAAVYRERWDSLRPAQTPIGLGSPSEAVEALQETVAGMAAFGIPLDVAWGEAHRVVRGDVDEPVSGCASGMGCFRTLSFEELPDGRRAANRGDAWVLAVELGPVPRAYSILAYGQSPDEASPHHADQAALFARGEMKPIAWTDRDIDRLSIRRYRPGREEPSR